MPPSRRTVPSVRLHSRLVVLAGAGISLDAPSSIPAGATLTDTLLGWLDASAPEVTAPLRSLSAGSAGPYGGLRFELLIEWLAWAEPRLSDWLAVLERAGGPNLWHRCLAGAIAGGATVLTTNFDTRIEQAAGHVRRTIVSASSPRARQLDSSALVKLHGSFGAGSRARPVATLTQIATLGYGYERSGTLRRWLTSILKDADLFVTGYSGWDSFDVMPLLEECAADAHIVWHDWTSADTLTIGTGTVAGDALPLSPLEDFMARRARHVRPTTLLQGPTAAAFGAVLPKEMLQAASTAMLRADASRTEPSGMDQLQAILAAPTHQLPPPVARAIVAGILSSHGAEDTGIPAGQRAAISELVPEPTDTPDTSEDAEGRARLVELIDSGQAVAAHQALSTLLGGVDPGGDLSGSELALTVAEDMFWAAFHRGSLREADRMAAILTRTALGRRSLWGLSRAANARGHIALRRSHNPRTTPARVDDLRAASVRHLTRSAELALRLDRLDAYLGTFRLIAWLAKPSERPSALAELTAWLPLAPVGIETATTLYDLACWACEAGEPDNAAHYAEVLTDLTQQLSNRDVSDMAVVARYAATLTSDPGKAEAGLREVLAHLASGDATTSRANRHSFSQRARQLAELTAAR